MKRKKIINFSKIFRDIRIKQTGNDSRFTSKVVTNKKKQASKNYCRNKKNL